VVLFPVKTQKMQLEEYQEYVDIQGIVESDQNLTIMPEVSGIILNVNVSEGDQVNAGQVLFSIDSKVLQDNIKELETALELAQTTFERQKNLWDQKIGSEIQYLQAKNRVDGLEKQMNSLKSQLAKFTIKAPVKGTVDRVFAKQGELAMPGSPMVRLVNNTNVKITGDVSEKYVGKFKKGDSVFISFPVLGESVTGIVKSVGSYIDNANRTFNIIVGTKEKTELLKPNLLAVIRGVYYSNKEALVVPSNLIINKNGENFIFIGKQENDKYIAELRKIEPGNTFNGRTEIKLGLNIGDLLITEGTRNLSEGDLIKIVD
jgi:RND family efflux transporter MFP subunit